MMLNTNPDIGPLDWPQLRLHNKHARSMQGIADTVTHLDDEETTLVTDTSLDRSANDLLLPHSKLFAGNILNNGV